MSEKHGQRTHLWIPYAAGDEIIRIVEREIADTADPDGRTVILLSGLSGVGKSTLLRELEYRAVKNTPRPRKMDPFFRHRPFQRVVLANGASPQHIAADIRYWQGMPLPVSHFKTGHLKVVEGVAQMRTKAIAIDHANVILTQGPRAQQEALKIIRFIGVTAEIPIILAGVMRYEEIVNRVSDPYEEFASRVIPLELKPFLLDEDFQMFVAKMCERFGYPDPAAMAESAVVQLHELTQGRPRYLSRGLRRLLRVMEGHGRVTPIQRDFDEVRLFFGP